MTDFSYIVDVPDLSAEKSVHLTATDAERAAIAERLGLVGIASLTANVTVTPLRKNKVLRVIGDVAAQLTQTCVVSLAPFDVAVETDFNEIYDRDAAQLGLDDDIDGPWDNAADIPEYLDSDTLDLGDIAVQYLSLALDPFPRKPDATVAGDGAGEGISINETERENPFKVLEGLKTKDS